MLRRVLRTYYKEREPTTLYKDLVNAMQLPGESALDFVFRTMDLRQKVCFASKEADSGLQYDEKLVKSMFLHTVATGLKNDTVRLELKSVLENSLVSDEQLLEAIQTATSKNEERLLKAAGAGTSGKTAKVTSIDSGVRPNSEKKSQDSSSELDRIKSEMCQIKAKATFNGHTLSGPGGPA